MPEAMLSLAGVNTHIAQYHILHGVDFEVPRGGLTMLLGRNGAGKTTCLRTIMGLWRASAGTIRVDGHDITRAATPDVAQLGVAYVPENMGIFAGLTVEENLRTGAYLRKDKDGVARDLGEVYGHFPRLAERRRQLAKTLSGGEQQMLAIGRALMSRPRLLLLDEPSLGLSPVMVKEIGRIVVDINRRGVPVVLVEQNAEMALRLASYGYVLETGRITLEGPATDLHEHEHVRAAYLGG